MVIIPINMYSVYNMIVVTFNFHNNPGVVHQGIHQNPHYII